MITLENFGLDVGDETTNKIILSRPLCNCGMMGLGIYASHPHSVTFEKDKQ